MTAPIDILRRIVATTPCTCAGWPHERCLICQASDVLNALKVPVLCAEPCPDEPGVTCNSPKGHRLPFHIGPLVPGGGAPRTWA